MGISLPYVKDTSTKLRHILKTQDSPSTMKTIFVNYLVNRKIERLQKMKTTTFMNLTVVYL